MILVLIWVQNLPLAGKELIDRKNRLLAQNCVLTLKVPITTAADSKFPNFFPNFRKIEGMIFHENRLPADNSHEISYDSYEISCLICYF